MRLQLRFVRSLHPVYVRPATPEPEHRALPLPDREPSRFGIPGLLVALTTPLAYCDFAPVPDSRATLLYWLLSLSLPIAYGSPTTAGNACLPESSRPRPVKRHRAPRCK